MEKEQIELETVRRLQVDKIRCPVLAAQREMSCCQGVDRNKFVVLITTWHHFLVRSPQEKFCVLQLCPSRLQKSEVSAESSLVVSVARLDDSERGQVSFYKMK